MEYSSDSALARHHGDGEDGFLASSHRSVLAADAATKVRDLS